ncbi:hypothetical protein [Aliarcobacter butzleri]|uniref:hypothetical protein n=1 Tax=Aliarcobacter butzleri TaxID=28197 RepID=UPI00125F2DAD|nr:hypothetical protein [Aliarcobacter butzleri]
MAEQLGFIQKVNKIYEKIDAMVQGSEFFNEETTILLNNLKDQELPTIIADLKKGNYLGNRKIDINLALNNNSSTDVPTYSKADIILVDGTKLELAFDNGAGGILELSSHADIKNYIVNHPLYIANVVDTEFVMYEAYNDTPVMIRVRDADGKASNIERIELYAYSGSVYEQKISYFWAKTTSALETLANRVGDIIQLGNDIDSIVTLSQRIGELISLQGEISKLIAVYNSLAKVATNADNINSITTNADNIDSINTNASNMTAINSVNAKISELTAIHTNITQILAAQGYATTAQEQAQIATQKVATIQAITAQANTLVPGSSVTVSYNNVSNKFTFGIPKGDKGDRGEAFKVNSIGTLTQRALYDDQLTNFSYLASDVVVEGSTIPHIYFKKSDATGDWTTGIPFGRGEKGDTGDTGISIVSIARTNGDGSQGSTDTYTITMSDDNTYEFNVYNGTDSDINSSDLNALSMALNNSINNHTGAKNNPHEVTKAQVGLSNVDNTSDANKPISIPQQEAFDLKADKSEVVIKSNGKVAENLEFTGNIIISGSIVDKTDIYSLGQPGEIGFGVSTALPEWYASIGAVPLEGHDIKTSPNYGNYMHMASGAILVCIPKHYYKITNNIFDYRDTLEDGFVIDRSFLNGDGVGGTVELPAIFVAKYGLTKNGTMASAQRYKDPLSTNSAHNPISALSNAPTNTYGGLYKAVKTLDVKAILTPIFHYTMLARMAKAHGQASDSVAVCAYIDVKPHQPKGCNNNALGDTNDANVTFTTSGYSNCGLTGSGVPFAKTTHNGQACGVADLNGNMWEVASGFIRTTANGFLVLKDTVDIRILADDGTGATGAYNIAHYDPIDLSAVIGAQNAWTYFGNANNQVFGFSTDKNSFAYKQTSIGIPLATGIGGTVEFGNDGLYRASVDQLAVLVGGVWSHTSGAGVFCMGLYDSRTASNGNVGGRASFLVQE